MEHQKKKMNLYVIAGCNGAGKTTASFTVLPEMLKCREFVNADEIAEAMVTIAKNRKQAKAMGEAGYRRLMSRYQLEDMRAAYARIYRKLGEEMELTWQE